MTISEAFEYLLSLTDLADRDVEIYMQMQVHGGEVTIVVSPNPFGLVKVSASSLVDAVEALKPAMWRGGARNDRS